jgi:hypothetical protein
MSQPSIGSFLKSQPKKRKLDDFDEGKLQKQLDGIEPGIWKRVEFVANQVQIFFLLLF